MTLRLSLLSFALIAACSTSSSKSTQSGADAATSDAASTDGADAVDGAADGADGSDGTDGEPLFTGQEALSSGGTYRGRLSGVDDGVTLGTTATASLVVTMSVDGTPADIAIEASFIHQGMGHGGPKDPTLSSGANGEFAIADLVPSMAGTWELQLELTGATGTETLTFELAVTP